MILRDFDFRVRVKFRIINRLDSLLRVHKQESYLIVVDGILGTDTTGVLICQKLCVVQIPHNLLKLHALLT